MIKKILLIGPLSPPITGNSLANDIVINGLKNNNSVRIDAVNTQLEGFKSDTGNFSFKKLFFYFKKYSKLYKVFKNDVIYITPGQTFYGVIKYAPFIYLAKALNKKIIIHIHGNYLKTQFDLLLGFKKYIFSKTINKANIGIVLSKSLVDNLNPFLPLKDIYIVSNFVEETLRPLHFKIRENEPLKIVYLSNLMSEKGVLDLMTGLSILKEKQIEFEAKFAGNIEEEIKTEIKFFLSIKEITYLGVVNGKQKKELLEWANVFVLPTYYKMEGVPISILEAMANGNIILTTKHAGIKDIISNKNGFFVEPKSPEDIVKKLLHIKSNINNLKEIRFNNINDSQKFTEKMFINTLLELFTN